MGVTLLYQQTGGKRKYFSWTFMRTGDGNSTQTGRSKRKQLTGLGNKKAWEFM